jgi:hypothetical protein
LRRSERGRKGVDLVGEQASPYLPLLPSLKALDQLDVVFLDRVEALVDHGHVAEPWDVEWTHALGEGLSLGWGVLQALEKPGPKQR